MAIECESCPKTFRTENGKSWHLENRHGQVRTSEANGQVKTTELELIVENEISAQVLDRNSPLNIALDERILGVLAEVKILIADSDRFVREHIEHRIDEKLQAITAFRREPAKVEDQSDALAPYRRKWPAATPAKVVDKSCPLSATGKRCDHLEPRRQHAALRSIGFPETPVREQAKPVEVVEMEGYFPGPLTGCLSHPHVQSRDIESSTSRTWWPDSEQLEHDRIACKALEALGYAV